jgi:hypothetical protein
MYCHLLLVVPIQDSRAYWEWTGLGVRLLKPLVSNSMKWLGLHSINGFITFRAAFQRKDDREAHMQNTPSRAAPLGAGWGPRALATVWLPPSSPGPHKTPYWIRGISLRYLSKNMWPKTSGPWLVSLGWWHCKIIWFWNVATYGAPHARLCGVIHAHFYLIHRTNTCNLLHS